MQDQDVHAYCRGLYDRTRTLWQSLQGRYPTWECRFSILYGPPCRTPDLLILGANPGYNPADLYDEEIQTWPAANEYVTRDWPLARRLRSLFADAGCLDRLQASLGTNVLFFKSKSLGRHESGLGWADNPPDVRVRLEEHCRRKLADLIRVLQPKTILTLSLSVFDGFTDGGTRAVSGESGRRIAAIGQAHGVRTLGIIHPTGAQVSAADWGVVASVLAGELKGNGTIRSPAVVARPKLPSATGPVRSMVAPPSRARQAPLRPTTVVQAATKPPASFGYQPIHDFWQELVTVGPTTVEVFHRHMLSIGWRRPQGKELTYDITRTDVASMCKHGFAKRLAG